MNGNETMLHHWMEKWRTAHQQAIGTSPSWQLMAMDCRFETAVELVEAASQERALQRQLAIA
ncbi:hypothetical protein K2D_16810 [Planctomycetes bacterium K2D]|nr:hypothetical protein K2D_16810 [Planctomycetes bacterium K2D]